MSNPRLLALMGSGETTPTMTATHRSLLDRLHPPSSVMLDTPYGFQENADVLTAKTLEYFQQATGRPMQVASFRRSGALELETAVAAIRQASLVFSGPGSPTYALRLWKDSPIVDAFREKLSEGGAVVLASAAACGAGAFAVPVYEIYKVGVDPHWVDGLDILGALGLPAVVLPHYNNAEGGNHDTRFCWLGEKRLRRMEEMLDPSLFILGLDEHTGCVFDFEAQTVTVTGKSCLTVRKQGRSTTFESGQCLPIARLLEAANAAPVPGAPLSASAALPASPEGSSPLAAEAERLEDIFDQALQTRNTSRALEAALALEQVTAEWAQDCDALSQQRARGALRTMLVRLGEAARAGMVDPNDRVAPFVSTLLSLREEARRDKEWRRADQIRDRLLDAGLEIQDTPEGTQWRLREPCVH